MTVTLVWVASTPHREITPLPRKKKGSCPCVWKLAIPSLLKLMPWVVSLCCAVEKGLHVVLQECSFLKPLFLDVEGVEERYDEDTVEALWQLLQFFADGHFVDAYVEDGDTGLGPLRSVRKWRLCQTSLRATFLGFLYLVLLAQSVIKQHQAPRIVKFNAFLTICLSYVTSSLRVNVSMSLYSDTTTAHRVPLILAEFSSF